MRTELYLKRPADELLALPKPSAVEGLEEAEERTRLMSQVGMTGRRRFERETADQADRLWLARMAYPELTGTTRRTWQSFLPTVYKLEDYTSDEVPLDALQEIHTAQQLQCFDRIIVRTPEGNGLAGMLSRKFASAGERIAKLTASIDPMAVGVVKGPDGTEHFFQIVRWGEALLPMETVKRHVMRHKVMEHMLFTALPLLLSFCLVAGYFVLIMTFGFWLVFWCTVGGIVGLAVLTFMAMMSDA